VLDLGCGLGGPARYLARHRNCQVTGVDITRENVEVATELTARAGLADSVTFRQADVTALPFPDASFDAAVVLHVGMSVPSKAALCAQAARVLRPGGRFVVYDVMQLTEDDGELAYPLPWASSPETSFLEPVAEYRRLLTEAGFEVEVEHDLRELVLAQLDKLRAVDPDNLPPIGPHVVLGENFRAKVGNLVHALASGVVAPIQLLAVR
jgi:ubiquinone/menaquinone biosynthesis C-methylase UbiE